MKATIAALSDGRWTVLAFAIAGFSLTVLQSAAYFSLAGQLFAQHAALGYSLSLQASVNAVLLPPPVHPETVAGYLELRALEPLAILFAAWATVSAPVRTSRQTIPHAAAFAIAVTVAAAASCIGVVVGVATGGQAVGALGVVEAGALMVAIAVSCYAISSVVAQVAPAPKVVAAGLMVVLFFLNSLSRVFTQLSTLRWLSPFRYYDLSTPLPPGGHFDVGGFAMLLAIATLGIAIAAFISTRRVAKAPLERRPTIEPPRIWLLAFPVARDLYPQRLAIAAWCIGFAALGVVLVAAARTSMQGLLAFPRGLPGLTQYVFRFYGQLLDETWFDLALLMFAALVFAFVFRWAADDRDGRLEAVLSAPYSRSAVVLERLTSLAATAAVLSALSGLAVLLTSSQMSLALDSTRLADACLLLVLFTVVLGAAGSLLTSSLPRAAPALFGAVLLAGYLDDQIGGPLGLPRWAQDISPFRVATDPLTNGVDGLGVALLILLTLALVGSSILAMQRHDVGARSPTKGSQART